MKRFFPCSMGRRAFFIATEKETYVLARRACATREALPEMERLYRLPHGKGARCGGRRRVWRCSGLTLSVSIGTASEMLPANGVPIFPGGCRFLFLLREACQNS